MNHIWVTVLLVNYPHMRGSKSKKGRGQDSLKDLRVGAISGEAQHVTVTQHSHPAVRGLQPGRHLEAQAALRIPRSGLVSPPLTVFPWTSNVTSLSTWFPLQSPSWEVRIK